MNNLAYSTQQPEKVVPKIEEILLKDLGQTGPISHRVEDAGAAPLSLGSFLKDAGSLLAGGRETLLFRVVFEITQPRAARLIVQVDRQGIGCHAGALLFAMKLAKPIKAEAALEAPKSFGTPKFQGDVEACGKLNGNKDLLKRADKFARNKTDVGGGMRLDRVFKIVPEEGGAMLVVATLPRAMGMGTGATTDAKEFFDLAAVIEAAL